MRRTDCSSIVAASRSTAAQAAEKGPLAHGIGRTKGGRNTKLHAVCDAKGRPHVLLLTPGNVHDCKVARLCIEALPPSAELVADKGYDSQALREWLDERGTEAVIPPRRNRKVQYEYDRAVYKQRNVIERMFCRLKDWRRLATRFDRNIKSFMGAVALAAAVIWGGILFRGAPPWRLVTVRSSGLWLLVSSQLPASASGISSSACVRLGDGQPDQSGRRRDRWRPRRAPRHVRG